MQDIGLLCQDETVSFENPLVVPLLALRCTAGKGDMEGSNALA